MFSGQVGCAIEEFQLSLLSNADALNRCQGKLWNYFLSGISFERNVKKTCNIKIMLESVFVKQLDIKETQNVSVGKQL